MTKEEQLLASAEEHVRAGRIDRASEDLFRLGRGRLERRSVRPFANLCRRTGHLNLGLKVLTPICTGERKPGVEPPDARELAEYAVLLQKSGVVREAFKILSRVDTREVPETWLYLAACHANQWEYPAAVTYLEQYASLALAPYAASLAKINLAASLLACEDYARAGALAEETLGLATAGNYKRLESNCLETLAQIHLQAGDLAKARQCLDRAHATLAQSPTHDQLFILKWRAVLDATVAGDPSPLLAFRALAAQRGHSESLRECDLFLLKVKFDRSRFEHLYAGTPFAAYRQRLCRTLGQAEPTGVYDLGSGERVLDVDAGTKALEVGGQIQRMLTQLSLDLYRPQKIGAIFSDLFPDEQFNVFTSPDRVLQIIKRSRKWLAENEFDLTIECTETNYDLRLGPRGHLRLAFGRQLVDSNTARLRVLRAVVATAPFTAATGAERLGVGPSTFLRWAEWAIENHHLSRFGSGKSTQYQFETGVPQ